MTKRFVTLAMMTFLALTAWADDGTYVPQGVKEVKGYEVVYCTDLGTITNDEVLGVPATDWYVHSYAKGSSVKYTQITSASDEGNPQGLTDNIATTASNVNMLLIKTDGPNFTSTTNRTLHMHVKGATTVIYHGNVGAKDRGLAIACTEYVSGSTTTVDTEDHAYSFTRSTAGGTCICQVTNLDATKEYIVTFYSAGSDARFYCAEFIGPHPIISSQPASTAEYTVGDNATPLSVTAETKVSGTMAYQWYTCSNADKTDASAIDNATSSSYTPSTTAAGTTYYFCRITNTISEVGYTTDSEIATIVVNSDTQSATITAETNQATTYDGTAQAVSASVSGGSYAISYYTNEAHTEGETTEAPISAGTYYAIVSQSDANYTSDPVNVTFTINKATLTATADNKSKTVGEANPELTVTVTGFVNGETAETLTAAGAYTAPTATCEATTESPAGTYDITVTGGSATNYTFEPIKGTLTVNTPISIYNLYDFATWAGDNISGDVGAVITDGNLVASEKTMTLNGSVSINGNFKVRNDNASTTGIHRTKGTGTLTLNNLKAGDWFKVDCTSSTETGAVLTFTNSNAYPLDEANLDVNGQALVSGTIYVVKEDGNLPFTFGDANAQSYIHKIEIRNTDQLPAPVINFDATNKQATITAYNSTKNNTVPTIYFAKNDEDLAVYDGNPISIVEPVTIKAQSVISDSYKSTLVSKTVSGYTINAPSISADGSGLVTITPGERSDEGEAITTYYTLDNSDPKTNENKLTYTDPFTPEKTAIVRAYSVYNNYTTVISDEASPLKVRIGTFTPTTNVYDFEAAAGDFQEITYASTAETLSYIYSSNNNTASFYEISADYLPTEGNAAKVLWRDKAGELANGGLKAIESKTRYIGITGLTVGQRVIIEFAGGTISYVTGTSEGAGALTGLTAGSSSIASETTYTVKAAGYIVIQCGAATVIKKISVLAPAPSYNLTVNYDNTKGSVTDENDNALAESYQDGTTVKLKATANADEGYQFAGWYDGETRLSLKNPYTITIDNDKAIKALFKQPATDATAVTAEKIWTFDDFTATTELSGKQVYEYDNLFICGHNSDGTNPAKVMAGTSSTDTGMGEVTNYLYFAGGNESDLTGKTVTGYNTDRAAFLAGVPGLVSVYTSSSSDTRKTAIVINGSTKQNAYTDLTLGASSKDITEANANVFVGLTGAGNIYAIKFTPEVVTVPVISVNENVGTITAGTSNLTEDINKDIKTYYTIDGNNPTTESLLYNGVIMASGTNITVKAISVNTVTGTKSEVTTQTGLTLALPQMSFSASVGTTSAGTVSWRKAGTTEDQADSYEQGTSIEVTATATGNYMFLNWTKGDEVVAKTPTYTFTLIENTTLVANFKDMGNTVPVILTAGQSNTDGRIQTSETAFPYNLNHTLISYCNGENYTTEGEFVTYGTTPMSDSGERWGYDAVVYNHIQTELGNEKDFYVIKQSKGNTGISPASGGVGKFWSANPVWLTYNTSANKGGKSLLKALCDQIDASLNNLPAGKTADIKFLMWHQGECDKGQGAAYATQLQAMINYVRNHLVAKTGNSKYSQLPVILGGIIPVPSDVNGCEYSEAVENAKQAVAAADEHIYYIDVADLGSNYTDYLRTDNVHFNADGATEFGNRVWQVVRDNNLLAGLVDGTGSTTPVDDILKKSDPVAGGTSWNFNEVAEGEYSTLTDNSGLYLHSGSSNKMNVKAANTEVSYIDDAAVSTTRYLQVSPAGDRSKFMKYGLTAGDVVDMDRTIGVNTSEAGTFYAIVAPDTNPTEDQKDRNVYLVFNGEKVDTKNVRTMWDGNDTHTMTLKYSADKAGTFFLTSDHAYRLYAAKFVKAGEETGGFAINTIAEGGSITMTAPTDKTLADVFSKNDEVTLQATADEGYTFVKWTDGDDQELGTSETLTFTVTSDITIKAVFRGYSAAVTYDFMGAYNGENSPAITYGTAVSSALHYYRQSDSSEKDAKSYPVILADPFAPALDGRLSTNSDDLSWAERGLSVKDNRVVAIHNLKVGDVIRIEYNGTLYYAKSNTKGGNALEGMTTGDIVKGLKAYTVSSVDGNNNYVILHTIGTTTISQISINQELTMKYVPKPTVSSTYTANDDSYTYTISYLEGATLHYTLPGGTEQTASGGESVNVNVTKIGDLTAYATSGELTSETASQRVYAPMPAIVSDNTYDFALVKEKMLKDYKLGEHQYNGSVTVGGMTMHLPDAPVANTLDRFAFNSDYLDGNDTKDGRKWYLMSAGRLRAEKSAADKSFAILNLKKGNYLTLTYSGGAEVKYAGGSATLAEGTEVLTSGTGYEILADGDLLLTVPANAEKNCDITVIRIATTETVSAPTLEERTESGEVVPNKVTLRLGTSSFGKTVTAYYTTDGSNPTTSSTAVTKNGAITVDESCTIKAYCVSETGVASGVTEYTVTLPAASKSASAVYDWLNVMQLGDELAFASDGLTVYNKEYDSTDGWITKQRKDFNAATNFGSKVSVRNGASGLSYDTDKKTIRLTKSMAIHNLGVGDEIVIIYTGDGTLRSAGADEGDAFTINGKTATAGMEIPSGATIKVTKTKYANNYVVVTPAGPTSGKVYISSIYINHEAPTVANRPKAELASVDLDRMTSTYRFTFDEGAMLYYKDTKDNEVIAGSNTGTFDLVVAESAKLKAWEMNGTLTSDTLSVTVYAPTPAPSTTGDFDFTEASEDLPADIEVTLDAGKSVSVAGETLYKPSALTAATFGDKFAFTETGSSNKIRIRTNHQLVFAKGTNMSMALLNMKKGDIIAFNYTGSITFADPSQVSTESSAVKARGMTRTVSNDMTSGTAYVVQADGNILLNLNLTEESTSISKMYIAAAPTAAAPAAIDFATASENYEEVETGGSTSVYVYGKSSAQTFKRLVNSSDELPIDGMISTEAGSGEITADGIKAANRHIAIHNLAAGDKITISFFGGALTYGGHETYGNRVSVDGKTLAAQSALKSGDVMVVEKVDYLNNYVVLKLDSKCCISGIFINRDEDEKVWAPTIIENGKNTVLITAGRSSLGYQVTTYYTTDGTDPSDRNGIGGPYNSYDVELLDGALVEVKAISYSSTGQHSKVTTLVMFADTRTEIIGVPVEEGQVSDIYDLRGRRVETPRPGQIYIINGKKVLYRRK